MDLLEIKKQRVSAYQPMLFLNF